MRFTKLSIDGFGRFSDTEVDLTPGLHIISGPNEAGKSTLRHFIADMLYGQKRSSTRRLYEDGNELRAPWNGNGAYGGRMVYRLDGGLEIEVERSFEREREFAKIFDRTNARDITGEFPLLNNRESSFAEVHLRMAKSVFTGVATISHVSLNDLGDRQALVHIREKLLSLTDSAEEDQSAEKAIAWLQERIGVIGDTQARTRPLPTMRQRLTDLQAEYQEVYEISRETSSYEKQRAVVLDEIGDLLNRKSEYERRIESRGRAERAQLLRRAESLQARIDELTQACFGLNGAREFPTGRVADVQRIATLLESAEAKFGATDLRLQTLVRERDDVDSKLRGQGIVLMQEADADLETRLADVDKQVGLLIARIDHVEQTAARAAEILSQAEAKLSRLPDFSSFRTDFVQHFSAITGAYEQARRAVEDEVRRLDVLKQRAADQEAALAVPRAQFSTRQDFLTELRGHESSQRDTHTQKSERTRRRALVTQESEDAAGRFPGYLVMTVLGFVFAIALGVVAALTGNKGIYLSVGFLAFMDTFFLVAAIRNRRTVRQLRAQLIEVDVEEAAEAAGETSFHALMAAAKCGTLRELEAYYERYRENEKTFAQTHERIVEQEAAINEAEGRRSAAEATLRQALAGAGEAAGEEIAAEALLTRVLTRYQEYREAKRQLGEAREAGERTRRDLEVMRRKLESARQQDVELSLQVRKFLRENHFPEEKQYDSALSALRNYRIRSAQMRQKQGELDVVQGQLKLLRREHDVEKNERDRLRAQLDEELLAADTTEASEYFVKAEQARRYQELWRERTALADQLAATLGDRDIDQLRSEAAADAPVDAPDGVPLEVLRTELSRVAESLEAKRKEDQALQLMVAERCSGHRSLNEVDEERAATEQRVAELELELKSASYAMSTIGEVTRERHTRIAPRLGGLASGFLRKITAGVYSELLVDRDMQISVRIPQTKSMNADPQRLLSKGTIDQIYFALRLAMVHCISENSECVPMVLDDPFANYDDERLLCAMKLLAEVGAVHQMLLFTCREDVVRAAESVGAPVTRL